MNYRDYHDSFGTTITLHGVDVDVTAIQRRHGNRAIICVTRDDTGEAVTGLSPETLESIRRQGIDGLGRALSELDKLLFFHDWHYGFSSGEAYYRGQREWQEILSLCANLPEAEVRKAWSKYGKGRYPFEDRKSA